MERGAQFARARRPECNAGSRMTEGTVLIVGEALMDKVVIGDDQHAYPGGSPMNVAYGLGRLGRSATLHTYLADDGQGRAIVAHLASVGVIVLPESFAAEHTSSALARIAEDGSATYDFDITWGPTVPELAPSYSALHVGSISALLAPGSARVLDTARAARATMPVFFDPNVRPSILGDRDDVFEQFSALSECADVIKLSDEDAGWLFPGLSVDHVLDEFASLGVRLVVVTAGASGAVLASTLARVQTASIPTEVVDTVGAGDSYMACLIDAVLERGLGEFDSGHLAEIGALCAEAAAITVSRAGASPPTRAELDGAVGRNDRFPSA